MLLNAKFDPKEIEKERQVIIEEINMTNDSPEHRVDMLIDELLWPAHPLGRDIAGSKETVAAVTREMMLSYQQGGYLPHNTVVAIAGNIPHKPAVTAVTRALGDWTGQRECPGYKAYQEGPAPRLRIENKDTEQVHLRLALPGLSALHPQRFALDLLNVILGEGMGSRLFTEIRDNLGLAYSISSYVEHFLDSGSVTVAAGVGPKNLTAVIKAILNELSRLREKVPEAELAKAKEQAKGRLLLRMENSRNVAGWIGAQEILTGRILTIDQVVAIIDAITTDELKKLAQELLAASRLRLAVVGRIASDEPLEELLRL
jgi:predicted Zn-dependent peptidase